ncbi:hypothetical protein D0Z07_9341 [Hyphodiscus hymeniophilus]|uniref:F-box domain-containing protein n=1 Tax=Hyphodiscus hymeniophilus TaxID=353542 RepID=A0A9P6SK92_9HELO|nr:hypothetical protein D0Z07_9341 [Hyphodiscus hymeniophilus]
MRVDSPKTNRLETLPTEIFRIIINFLCPWDVKDLSRSSKRLREACLPSLFRRVKFQFSQAGFDGLKNLLKSDARNHIVSFTYVVPELLKADLLDFDYFRSDILTPDSYVETAKELYDAGDEADGCTPYMVIYETAHSICNEQRNIVDNSTDLSVLSSTLGALPRLTEVGLSFCETIDPDNAQLLSFASVMISVEYSYEYHIRVISDALQSARRSGVTILTISLSGFDLPYYHTWEVPGLSTLSESLKKLLEFVQILRLTYSNSPLELLSHSALNLHQLDMCHVVSKYNALEDFLGTNKSTIRFIGFHDVEVTSSSQLGHLSKLTSGMLCEMLNVPQSTPCRAVDCGCLLFRKEGWRLLLNDIHVQPSAGTLTKSKFDKL